MEQNDNNESMTSMETRVDLLRYIFYYRKMIQFPHIDNLFQYNIPANIDKTICYLHKLLHLDPHIRVGVVAHVREVCHCAHEIVCECWEVPVGDVPLHAELPEFCNGVSQELGPKS